MGRMKGEGRDRIGRRESWGEVVLADSKSIFLSLDVSGEPAACLHAEDYW
jgi:hypothetical protein